MKTDLYDDGRAHEVLAFFNNTPGRKFTARQVAAALGVTVADVTPVLETLLRDAYLLMETRGSYRLAAPMEQASSGRLMVTRDGTGFVTLEGQHTDVRIDAEDLAGAWEGDLVELEIDPRSVANRPRGRVLRILEAAHTEVVGTMHITRQYAYVTPDNRKLRFELRIAEEDLHGAVDGQKVLCKLHARDFHSPEPTGYVTQVLGEVGSNDAEMLSIILEAGFPLEFPPEVAEEAANIPTRISVAEIGKRKDLRDVLTFTIDPADAKDFDDALSLQDLGDGEYEIGIHIADVSHYVLPGTALDKEALRRATSVYLVDRVVPMLPEVISNLICSLRPNEDKLTYSAIFTLTKTGQVRSRWFGRTIIHSDRRFSYEEAQELIEGKDDPYTPHLRTLNRIANALRGKRFKDGAIEFNTEELRFNLDAKGKPLSVYVKERKAAHMLIEEFMLLANREVAEHINAMRNPAFGKAFVYRIHDVPDPAKLGIFAKFVSKLGYDLRTDSPGAIAASMNKLLADVQGTPEQNPIEGLAVRAMAKAIYTTKNIGHYGLGFDFYTHFTSPIRRYPDVMAHRLLAAYDGGQKPADIMEIERQARHSSDQERKAANAERASIKYKQVEMLLGREGETFAGTISGVTEGGLFLQLTINHGEGFVRLSNLKSDFYKFDEENFRVVGENTGRVYRFGDAVEAKLLKVDVPARQLDLMLIEQPLNGDERSRAEKPGFRKAPKSAQEGWPSKAANKARSGSKPNTGKRKR